MAKLTNEEIISSLKEMTLIELNELVKAIEEEFGVTAAAPVAVAAAPAEEAAATGPTEVTLTLKSSPTLILIALLGTNFGSVVIIVLPLPD